MAVRIQLRRDTSANWISSNPVLREGEMGIETDTLKIKLGNGTSTWTQISGYMNLVPDGNLTIGDYVMVNDIGAAEGVVGLDINKNAIVTGSSIILEGSTNNAYETTLTVTDPTADRTITFKNADGTVAFVADIPTTTDALTEGSTNKYFTDERAQDATAAALAAGSHTNITVTYNDAANSLSLAAAPGYVDEQAVDAVAAALAAGTHTNISVSYDDAGNSISLTGAQTYNDENAQDAIGNNLGTGLSYNDTTGAISVNTSVIQARVSGVSDTEIGYLDGVTSGIQSQLNDKLASATAATTYAPLASPTFTGSVTLPGAPTLDLHAATKAYVDASTSGLNVHASVKAATTANINLNNQLEAGDLLDGVTLSHNDRVLVKNQNTASENGIYTVEPNGAAIRAADYNTTPEVDAGDFIFVESGTVNGKTGWIQTNTITTIGIDAIAFTQFSGSGTYTANNGLTLSGTQFSINTAITADLSTTQTLTNKTLTSPVINTPTGITKSDVGLANVDNTSDVNKPISTATQTALDLKLSSATAATTYETIANVALKAPINSPTFTGTVSGITKAMVGLGNVENTALSTWAGSSNITTLGTVSSGLWSGTAIAATNGGTGITSYAAGDILYSSATNTLSKLAKGTDGQILTLASGVPSWAAAPITLPTQTGNSGKYLTTDGTSASWGTLVVPITTGTATVSANTATTVDTTALSAFTSAEYMVSLRQGSKIRTSKVIVQDDGTNVDMTEFAITETGGTMSGVVVSAVASGSNALLQVTVTDALTTNVTVKFSKVAL